MHALKGLRAKQHSDGSGQLMAAGDDWALQPAMGYCGPVLACLTHASLRKSSTDTRRLRFAAFDLTQTPNMGNDPQLWPAPLANLESRLLSQSNTTNGTGCSLDFFSTIEVLSIRTQ